MKKRLILTICTMVMFIAMMIPLTVGASADSDVQIECTVTAQTETSVTIDVSVTSNPGFMYLELTKNFPSEFTLTSITNGSVISDLTKGTKYIWIADEDVTSTGTLCTLVFSIPEGTAPGNYTVSLGVGMCGNYEEQSVGVSISSCTVTVACNHSFTKEDTTYLKSEATCTSPAVYYKSCVTCGEKGTETFNHGLTKEHSYTKQVTTDAYKKSSASCTAKAVYYYCCATCSAKGTTTYEYGTTLSHNYTRKVVTDAYKKSATTCTDAAVYYYCCATCDAKGTTTYTNGSELGHTGGTATCTSKAVCTRCSQSYGDTLTHVYTDEDAAETYLKSGATCTSKAIYYKNCATCDKAGSTTFEHGTTVPHSYTRKVTTDTYKKSGATCTSKAVYYFCCETCTNKGTETYESGTTLTHNYTRQVITDDYKKSGATCTDKAVYYYCCATCDNKGTTTFEHGTKLGHTGGTATCISKAVCTRCSQEYGDTLTHVYTNEDAIETYLKSGATCTSKAIYYKNCATCDKAGTETFEYGENKAHSYIEKVEDKYLKSAASCTAKAVYFKSCQDCGIEGTGTFEIGDTPTHQYKTSLSYNSSSHWYECSKCGDKKDSESHSSPLSCSVCGYRKAPTPTPTPSHTHSYNSSWTSDANKHWHACSGCSSVKDKNEHTYENACDTDCSVCGYVRTVNHNYSTEWSKDEKVHWYECSVCGDKKNEASHTIDATNQTCSICSYVTKETPWKNLFNDVKESDWYFDAVKYVNVNKLMGGTSASTFAPNEKLTRAMFVTILYRLENEPSIKSDVKFNDVDENTWYTNAVAWAYENGIAYGVSEKDFAPNANITREQIATIMYRYSTYKSYSTKSSEISISSYKDADTISEFAFEAMEYAVESGLINGKTATTLNPKDNATRAEIAIIIQRFIENIK